MTTQAGWTRVIVLSPSVSAPSAADHLSSSVAPATSPVAAAPSLSEELRTMFTERDWFAIEHHDPYLAMAELCLRERAQASRAAWGLQRMEQLALVLLHPERCGNRALLDQLAGAVHRCLPAAGVYLADDHHIEAHDPERAATPPSPTPCSDHASRFLRHPVLKAVDLPRPQPLRSSLPSTQAATADDMGPRRADEPNAGRLSRDELDMLLSDDADARDDIVDLAAGADGEERR